MTSFDLSEHALIGLGIPDHGWTGHRPALPDNTVSKIRDQLADELPENQVDHLVASLQRGFSGAVEMALYHHRLQEEIKTAVQTTGRKKRPPRKLGVILRDYTRNLRQVLSQADRGERRVTLTDFFRDIERIEVLDRLVTLQLEERLSFEVIDPLRNSPERSANLLPDVLEYLEGAIDAGIKSGPSNPALNHLARVFVFSYFAETGKKAGRTWDAHCDVETGLGLEICRLLARELNQLLPDNYRSSRPADMAKPYRNAIQVLQDQMAQET